VFDPPPRDVTLPGTDADRLARAGRSDPLGMGPPLGGPREGAVTQPGIPLFLQTPEPARDKGFPAPPDGPPDEPPPPPPPVPPKVKTPTLEFNFDDMVAGLPVSDPPPPPNAPRRPPEGVPPPISSPPVPQDKTQDMTIDDTLTAWDKSNPGVDVSKILTGDGGGIDIISTPPPAPKPRSPAQLREEVATLLAGAKDLLDLDDHSGAMELINKALELDPADSGALKLKERSEKTLQAMFESKLGDLNQLPRVKLKEDEIIWLNLDHRAGFVLAQIDGSVTFEDLFAVSGMSRLDTARILAQLVEEGVITKS
jgi:hypothetical protein